MNISSLTMTTCPNPVADVLETLMGRHRLSQTDLANRSGVSQPAINRILNEKSRAKNPRKETLQKLADALGVTPEQLTGHEPLEIQPKPDSVPVISWEDIGRDEKRTPVQWLCCPVDHGRDAFAISVVGDAMIGEGGYSDGDYIFVDPGIVPDHGKDIVVFNGANALFRRLMITPEGGFLKALNPDWPMPVVPLQTEWAMCGTVIFSGRVR